MMRFAQMQRVSLIDPNGTDQRTNSFKKYTRENILTYLKDPRKNKNNLIKASNYLYASSVIYNRVCRYLANMLTFDYIVYPYKMKEYDTSTQNVDEYSKAYFKILNELEVMNIKQSFTSIMQVVVREGAFFGLEVGNKDSYVIQQMPYDKCKVTSFDDGCPIFSLDMSYFDKNQLMLEDLGSEINSAYKAYKANSTKAKWAEMDSKSSICILFDETLDYVLPPFSGAFTDIYLVEDYKDLMKSKEIINLYKLINLKYPIDDEGRLLMDEEVATTYYHQFADQVGEQIGVTLNPFEMNEVSFNENKADSDGTLKAQRDMFGNLGISNLLFSNEKASSTALIESVKEDFSYVIPVLRSIERWLCKKLKMASGKIKFQIMMPEINVYNRKEMLGLYKESASLGLPTKTLYTAAAGITPHQMIGLTFLENNVLGLQEKWVPLQSSYTQSSDAGRPLSDTPVDSKDASDEGNANRVKE